jgi:adenylosuccinate lyase
MKEYQNPLITRYASKEMSYIFSPDYKFTTWRKLWVALAESQKELGLPITDAQLEEMKSQVENIDYELAKVKEKEFRHDVMAHIHTYGEACPSAKGIIHWGATSAYVGDNTDVIQIRAASDEIERKLVNLIERVGNFAMAYRSQPTLGFTHFQPAQLTTVGKRAGLWLQDLVLDYEMLIDLKKMYRFRGVKGTTGTQASYMKLFDNDDAQVKLLEAKVATKMGFEQTFGLTGQTYTRKLDSFALNVLGGIAQSLHKITNDIRLLQHLKEVEEPFGKNQIGSSAMAYKRNPMRSERIAALAKFVISNTMNPALVEATQWFERTLDDSANKRLAVAQGYLATDSILAIGINIFDGLVVYPEVIHKHIMEELPFIATENILMEAVKKGGDRQALHEEIRVLSMEAGAEVKVNGKSNDLMERIIANHHFDLTAAELKDILDPKKYTGRSAQQVEEYMEAVVQPILDAYQDQLNVHVELSI